MHVCGGEVEDSENVCGDGEVQKNMCVVEKFTSFFNRETSNSLFCTNTRQKNVCIFL